MVQSPEHLEEQPPAGFIADGISSRFRLGGFRENLPEQVLVAVGKPALGRLVRQRGQESPEDFQHGAGGKAAVFLSRPGKKRTGLLEPPGPELPFHLVGGQPQGPAEVRHEQSSLEGVPQSSRIYGMVHNGSPKISQKIPLVTVPLYHVPFPFPDASVILF